MRDVARVELGAQTYNNIGRLNGAPAAIVNVYQLPGFNALEAVQGARRLMEELKRRFPVDMDYVVSLDTTLAVTEGIREIYTTLWQAMLLVILVVFIFLQSARATLIPAVAVPVSLIGTFVFFPLLGFSVNTLSLFGLVLAIGLVVDDAIVVVEAVEKKLEAGLPPKEAAIEAMREVSGPVVAIALVLIAVFAPTAFIPGITGRLYQQFAVTIALSVAISAFNALTLSPALCALVLKPHGERQRGPLGRVFAAFNRGFERATNGYVGVCGGLIRKSALSLLLLAAIAAGAGVLGWKLPTGFLPTEDQGFLLVNVTLPEAASLQRTDVVDEKGREDPGRHARREALQLDHRLQPARLHQRHVLRLLLRVIGAVGPAAHARDESRGIMESLNRRLAQIAEARAFAFPPPAIAGVGTSGGFSFMLQDRAGRSVDYLARNVDRFLEAARQRPELTRVNSSLIARVPQVYANVDRDKVLKQEVDLEEVYRTLNAFMGTLFVNYFNRFGRQWQVYVGAEGEYRTAGRGGRAVLRPQQARPDGPALGHRDLSSGGRGPSTRTASTSTARRRSPAAPPRAIAPARPWPLWRRWRSRCSRPTWATRGTRSRTSRTARPSRRTRWPSSGSRCSSSSSSWPRSTRAGRCPSPCCWARPSPCSGPWSRSPRAGSRTTCTRRSAW